LGLALAVGWRAVSALAALAGGAAALALHRSNASGNQGGLSAATMCRISGAGPYQGVSGDEEDDGLLSAGLKDRDGAIVDRGVAKGSGDQRLVAAPLLGTKGSALPASFGTGAGDPNPFTEPPSPEAELFPTDAAAAAEAEAEAEAAAARLDSRASAAGIWATARVVASSPPLVYLFAATSFRTAATVLAAAYFPVYFARAFPTHASAFGWAHAAVILVGGGGASFWGGRVADFWAARDPPALAWLPGLGALASSAPAVAALHCHSFPGAVALLLLFYGSGECWLGPAMTLLQVPRRVGFKATVARRLACSAGSLSLDCLSLSLSFSLCTCIFHSPRSCFPYLEVMQDLSGLLRDPVVFS
jgi:hypothetical protein